MNTKRTLVISHNWLTNDTQKMPFEGDDAVLEADRFLQAVAKEFPKRDGWTHFMHRNEAAILGALVPV